jgi:GT2 family glycosyltransferase
VFVFGVAVLADEEFRSYALPGIRRVAEPDSLILERPGPGSVQEKYNSILDEAARHEDLEGVVLPHEDVEIVDDEFLDVIRRRFRDPTIAVLGVVGGRGVSSIAWGLGTETFGSAGVTRVVPHVEERFSETTLCAVPAGAHEVDAVDGILLVLSPWATRELRFDEAFSKVFHGYDVDLCFQARERGRRVVVEELRVIHHTLQVRGEGWVEADVLWQRKWRADRAPGDSR